MSDIQRFRVYDDDEVLPVENGEYVAYADHVAAVAAARAEGVATLNRAERAWRKEISDRLGEQYEQGQRDERERILAAVEALPWTPTFEKLFTVEKSDVLAVIDGEKP
jgi:aminopeptidase N